MGESFGSWKMGLDSEIMPHIDIANIACGFHASDPNIMAITIKLAIEHQVQISAHPAYADKQGFGRRHIPHSIEEIKHLITYQIGALQSLCQLYGGTLDYIKPHGALYHDMMNDIDIFEAIVNTIHQLNKKHSLIVLANANSFNYKKIADKYQVPLLYEAFADRAYQSDGNLVPRSNGNAVLTDKIKILNHVKQLTKGFITSQNGEQIKIKANTICVHGDNLSAVALIQSIAKAIKNAI